MTADILRGKVELDQNFVFNEGRVYQAHPICRINCCHAWCIVSFLLSWRVSCANATSPALSPSGGSSIQCVQPMRAQLAKAKRTMGNKER